MTAQPETMHCKTHQHSHNQKHGHNHDHNYGPNSDHNQRPGVLVPRHDDASGQARQNRERDRDQGRDHDRSVSPDFYRYASKPQRSHHGHDVHISPRTSHVGSFSAETQPGLDFRDSLSRTAREKEIAADYSYGSTTGNRLSNRRSWSRSNSRRSSISGGSGGNINSNMATLSISPIGTPIDTNALDAMEKEQEGIVMKMMHEIQALKDENKMLKNMLRANSVSSSNTEPSSSPTSSGSSISSPSTPFMSQRRATFTTMTNMKRVPASLSYSNSNGSITNVSTFPRSRSGSLSMNWKASTLSPKLSGMPNITLTESFPFDTEYFSLTPHRSSIRNPGGAPPLSIPQKILSYSNSNEEAIDDANLDQTWELRQDIQPHQQQQRTTKGSEEDSESEPRKLEPFKKLHKRSVSDNTECNISKQYKLDSLAASQSRDRDREGKTADVNVSSGLMIRHFDGK